MRNDSQLSIIIISHGHEEMVTRCIQSLKVFLDGVPAKIVVIDNLKRGILRDVGRLSESSVLVLENHCPIGFAANVNRGVRAATGEYLLLLNPDMVHRRGRILDGIGFMAQHPKIAILGCRLANRDGTLQVNYRRFPKLPTVAARLLYADQWPWQPCWYRRETMSGIRSGQPIVVDWVFGAFMLMRKGDFKWIGGMDEGFRLYYEDVDLCLRFRKEGLSTWHFPGIEFFHDHLRTSAGNPLSRHGLWHMWSMLLFFLKHRYLIRPPIPEKGVHE